MDDMILDSKARTAAIGIAVLAVAASIAGMYYFLSARGGGSPGAPGPMSSPAPGMTMAPSAPAMAPAPGAQGAKGVPTMVEAAERLSKRLGSQGGTADDWALLARTYVELRQYADAVGAFQRALEKSPNDPALKKEAEAARKAVTEPPPLPAGAPASAPAGAPAGGTAPR